MLCCDLPDSELSSPSSDRKLLVRQVWVFTRPAAYWFKRAASGGGNTTMLHSFTWLQPFILQSCFSCKKRLPMAPLASCCAGRSVRKGSQLGQVHPLGTVVEDATDTYLPESGCLAAAWGWVSGSRGQQVPVGWIRQTHTLCCVTKHQGCDEGKAKQNCLENAKETVAMYTFMLFVSLRYAQLFILCKHGTVGMFFSLSLLSPFG